jgi:cytochrome c-type biogenesis protein CcmF
VGDGARVAGAAWPARARLRERTLIATLAAQAAIALGFYAFLLFASNPFERLEPGAVQGQGLNPLLQDPGLAFHPPTLYLGYVGISVAFSFAVGALITRDVGPAFARAMRPWVLGAWVFLTLGITAGSYWAYYELGWGGWWFWDPVENASLMPWLAATALLHSVNVLATRDGLARLDGDAGGGRLLHVDGRHLPGPLGHPHQRPRLRGRSAARRLHPDPARLYIGGALPCSRCASAR